MAWRKAQCIAKGLGHGGADPLLLVDDLIDRLRMAAEDEYKVGLRPPAFVKYLT